MPGSLYLSLCVQCLWAVFCRCLFLKQSSHRNTLQQKIVCLLKTPLRVTALVYDFRLATAESINIHVLMPYRGSIPMKKLLVMAMRLQNDFQPELHNGANLVVTEVQRQANRIPFILRTIYNMS